MPPGLFATTPEPQKGRQQSRFIRRSRSLVLSLLFLASLALAQQKVSEYQVKAAYLYNFGRFVEWPSDVISSQSSFTICVFGADPFGPTLDAMVVGATIAGKGVTAKRISSPQDLGECRILFITSTEVGSLNKIVEAGIKHAVLTVSDMPEFASKGGMIQFVLEDKKIRFEVNLAAAQSAGLTLSADLLKVATAVRRTSEPGN
jgi:YfiR/HmsC-like